MIRRISTIILFALIATNATSQITLVNFASGLSAPVDIKNCGDDRLFVVEQAGVISIIDTDGTVRPQPFLDITGRVLYSGEQGLLGVAFPADFLTSGYFYVDYVADSDGNTHIARFHVDSATPDSADPSIEETILNIYQPYGNHKGGDVAFGPDGYLYIGMGDGGSGGDPENRAQNPDSLLGKILRISVTPTVSGYEIPPTNVFAQDTTLGRGEVYDYGVRNPWRWSFDRLTGDLWIGDVGQNAIEEVDIHPAGTPSGMNFGWRCYEADAPYNTGGCQAISAYDAPVLSLPHSPTGYCSVAGGYVYRGTRYQELYGKYFYSDYCVSRLQYLEPDGLGGYVNTDLGTFPNASSLVAFGEDRHGEIYCSSVTNGSVYKIVSADCSPVATINAGKDTITDCGTGSVDLIVPADTSHSYLWTFNGDTVSTSATYNVNTSGEYIVQVSIPGCSSIDSIYANMVTPLTITFGGLDTFYCTYNSAAHLLPNLLGGSFTGNGITGATFVPAVAGVGDHQITYTYKDATGCTYSHSQNVHVDACTNVPENVWTNSLSVYPNPSGGDFSISVFAPSDKEMKIEITDITGRTVSSDVYVIGRGENTIPFNRSLSTGAYVIRISDDESSASRPLIIQ